MSANLYLLHSGKGLVNFIVDKVWLEMYPNMRRV